MKFFTRCLGALLVLAARTALITADDTAGEADGYYNQFSVCDESSILVQDISITCDSPGAYYYGSNKYRNSASCQSGDKANMQVDFVILQDLEYDDAYLTLDIKGYGSVESISLHTQDSFCESVVAQNGVVCPEAGYYTISERFYWGSQNDSYEYSFVPKVVIGIASGANQKYDLGGANTNQCDSGNTFMGWTKGAGKTAADTFVTFMLTFGTLLAVLIVIFLVGYLLMKQAKRRVPKKEVIVDEELDEASYQAIRDNRSIVEFY